MTEISNIVFDIGNVLVDWNPQKVMRKYGMTEEDIAEFEEKIFRSGVWDKSDEGIMTKEEFVASMVEVIPRLKNEITAFFENIGEALSQFDYTKKLIETCKAAGYKVYILSNYSDWAYEQSKDDALSFLPMLDGELFSYRCKLIKPDDRIYEELLREFNLNGAETIFMDDREDNVEAARKNGINAFVFKGINQAIKELASYGVKIEWTEEER